MKLPDWLEGHFPASGDSKAFCEWEPNVLTRTISTHVLAVAYTRIEGAWKCVLKEAGTQFSAPPGYFLFARNHDDKFVISDVIAFGTPQPENVARALFPQFEGVPYAD